MKEHDVAYLAGIVDADGYITIQRRRYKTWWYYGAVVGITGTRSEPHNVAAEVFGGRVGEYGKSFLWKLYGPMAAKAILDLYPHLRIKRHQADLAVETQYIIQYQQPYTDTVRSRLGDLHYVCAALNLRRPVTLALEGNLDAEALSYRQAPGELFALGPRLRATCGQGHFYLPDAPLSPSGSRRCLICERTYRRKHRARTRIQVICPECRCERKIVERDGLRNGSESRCGRCGRCGQLERHRVQEAAA